MISTLRHLLAVSAAALGSVASAADRPPQLAYVQQNANGRFELRMADPATGQSVRVQSLLASPLLVIWSRDAPEVMTLRDNGVYRTNYRTEPGVGNPAGDAPPAGLTIDDAWIAKDGKTLLAVGANAGAAGTVTCALYAVPKTGAWRKLEAPRPADASGDDDPCGSFASAERGAARSVSSLQLARRQQCTAEGSPCKSLGGQPGDVYADLRKTVAAQVKTLNGVAIADPGKTAYLLALGMQIGDMPHLARPVNLVARQGLRVRKPPLNTPEVVQVGLRGRYALIAEEFSGKDPIVVDMETGKTVLTVVRASGAVWVP